MATAPSTNGRATLRPTTRTASRAVATIAQAVTGALGRLAGGTSAAMIDTTINASTTPRV